MTAAEKRKEKLAKIRWLLKRQGEDFSLSHVETTFPIHLEMQGLPELTEPDAAVATINVQWGILNAVLVAWMARGGLEQIRAAVVADTLESSQDQAADFAAEGIRRREPGMLRAQSAYKHMRVYAPEVFDGAMRLLLASAEAWAAYDIDDDEDRAAKIIDEALKVEAQAARERLNLRTTGRRRAVKRTQVRLALFALFSSGAERPYTREQVADYLQSEFGVTVTSRTLTDLATMTTFGDWDSYVSANVADFEHLAQLESEELDILIDETAWESH